MSKKRFLWGTMVLTGTGLLSRLIGFFYRIFLSQSIGAQGLGIYQLVMPLQNITMAITVSGIQTAISRLAATGIAKGHQKKAKSYLVMGTGLSLLLSLAISILLYRHADFFALHILQEEQTLPLIRLLAFCFPMEALHTCINSYYFARKQTALPSALQLLEQLVRVGTCYLLYLIFLSRGIEVTPIIAIGGSLAGETAASLLSLFAIGLHFQAGNDHPFQISQPLSVLKELLQMSVPLTLNRILLTLLASMEMILIPRMLLAGGLNSAEALEVYGVFTGMALPLILFPSAITNSASVLLMPSVAELQALGLHKRIRYVVTQSGRYCLLLGFGCTGLFFFFGKPLCMLMFKSEMTGTLVQILAFLCPFLYLNTTLSSILNGLGYPGLCLIHSVIGISIRIGFVVFAIPRMGIRGYLYGLLLSELTLSLLHILAFLRLENRKD